MGRAIGGIVAGILVAGVVVFAVEMLGMAVYPPPEGMNPADPDSIRQYTAQMPAGAFAFVLASWVLAAFAGPWTAQKIARSTSLWPGLGVGALFGVACIYNLVTIPSPIWMIAGVAVLVPAAIWIGTNAAKPAGGGAPDA